MKLFKKSKDGGPDSPNKLDRIINPIVTDECADFQALTHLFYDQQEKLAKKREEGRGGWHRPQECPVERLAVMLIDHLKKGDPVDIANFAMMLHGREGGGQELADIAHRMLPTADPGGTKDSINFTEWYARLCCQAQAHGFPVSPDQDAWREWYDAGLTPGDALHDDMQAAVS